MFLTINLAAKLLTNIGLSLSELDLSVIFWYPQEPKDETWNQTVLLLQKLFACYIWLYIVAVLPKPCISKLAGF